jgi:hypothetical protein
LEDFPEMMMSQRPSRQIDTWRVPPNWSRRDWLDEMKAEGIAAAWEAERDFDPTLGVPLEAVVHWRVWARAWSRARREWTYLLRCGFHLKDNDCADATANGFSPVEVSKSLRHALDRLPEHQRELIVSLFWEEKTEVEITRMFSRLLADHQRGLAERNRVGPGLAPSPGLRPGEGGPGGGVQREVSPNRSRTAGRARRAGCWPA